MLKATDFGRTPNPLDSTVGFQECGLPAVHIGTVAEHEDADKGIAVCVPIHDSPLVVMRISGEIDVSNLIVSPWNEFYACKSREDSQSSWMIPSLVGEWGMPDL